jgi:membrane-associated phospholipid phosphatase
LRKYIFILYFLGSLSVFSQTADYRILKNINAAESPQKNQIFGLWANSVGPVSIGVPALLLGYDWCKKPGPFLKNRGVQLGGALLLSGAMTVSLKYAINRPRPFVTWPDIEKRSAAGSPSFPSGHTSTSFTLATSLTLKYKKWYVAAPAYIWACGMAYSRMYQGVHYPSDVFFGALSGASTSYLCHVLQQKLSRKK